MANSIAYGFLTLKDLFAERLTTANAQQVQEAVRQSIEEYQRESDALMSLLVTRVTDDKRRFQLTNIATLQPLDEHGNPLPILPSGFYDVAFPIQGAGIAWGDDRVTRALMTIEDANRFTLNVIGGDLDWLARHILAAIFTNVTWTYVDPLYGNLVVQPLANGDSVIYVRKGGASSIDNHYLAQLNAIDNSNNPFDNIYDELSEHPSNGGPFVAYIPTALKTSVTGLSTFTEIQDPDIRVGVNADTVIGQLSLGLGDEVLGKSDKMWIVEWKRLPAEHIVAVAHGANSTPLAMREYPAASLQGLFPEFQDVDGNRHLNKFIRYAGFGALNRVAALVYRIGNAAYAIPTGFTAPLPV